MQRFRVMTTVEEVYGAFVDYYGDMTLQYVKTLEDRWVMYGAKIYSGLNQNRYIFVIAPKFPIKNTLLPLSQLDWVSFQTRYSDMVHQVPTHKFFPDESQRKKLADLLTITGRTATESLYITVSLPIKVRLLHDAKKNNYLQFPDKARLYQALETYRCVVDIL